VGGFGGGGHVGGLGGVGHMDRPQRLECVRIHSWHAQRPFHVMFNCRQ
jgi:hypothetical protein